MHIRENGAVEDEQGKQHYPDTTNVEVVKSNTEVNSISGIKGTNLWKSIIPGPAPTAENS